MDQSDLLPRLQQKISEAPTDTDLDQLRRDVVTAFQHCDLTPWELEETMYAIRERRSFLALVKRQGGRLKEIAECETVDGLNEIAKVVKADYAKGLITVQQFRAICDAGRTRRGELTK
jgi:hypothetical protein